MGLGWGTLYSDVLAADEEDADPPGSPHGDLYTVSTSVVVLSQTNNSICGFKPLLACPLPSYQLGLSCWGWVLVLFRFELGAYCYSIVNSA